MVCRQCDGHQPDTRENGPSHDAVVKRLPRPATGNKLYRDDLVTGFAARVTAAGARSFVLNYVTKAGRERRITIGDCGDWATTAARARARDLRREIDAGGDPLADVEAEREAPTVAGLINDLGKST
jgi:hypothetical protein